MPHQMSPNQLALEAAELDEVIEHESEAHLTIAALLHMGNGIHRLASAVDRLGFNSEGEHPAHGIGEALVMRLREIPFEELVEALSEMARESG